MRHHSRILAGMALSLVAAVSGAPVAAQERPARLEVWDLRLGTRVDQLPDEFVDYACGTNGGPPSVPLNGWNDFRRCRPEPSGLREVYFRYDDELEYWAKANSLADQMEQYSGTKTYGFPVVVSGLIDAEGLLGGIRIVSDPRDTSQNRDEAYLLRNFLTARSPRALGATSGDARTFPSTATRRRSTAFLSNRTAACRSTTRPARRWRRAICASQARAASIRIPGGKPPGNSKARHASSCCGRDRRGAPRGRP